MARKDAMTTLRQILVRRRDALRQALAGDLSLLKELQQRFAESAAARGVDFEQVSFRYEQTDRPLLHRLTFTVQPGELDLTGIVTGTGIDTNGGTIQDAATNSAYLSINAVEPSTAGIEVGDFIFNNGFE